jgi:predicted protein tyrosine phosphatase
MDKEIRHNALWNCQNPNQGDFKRVLCVCSAGLLRSPTIAYVLSQHGYNTRAAGVHDYALVEVDDVLIQWADIIIFAAKEHHKSLKDYNLQVKEVHVLNIPDAYQFRDPKLVEIITEKLTEIGLINV